MRRLIILVYGMTYSGLFRSEKFLSFLRSNLYRIKWLFKKTSVYRIKKTDEVSSFIVYLREDREELQYLPAIHKLTKGGEINVVAKGYRLYKFRDVTFALNSDFIRFSDHSVFCEKLSRREAVFSKVGDSDVFSIDRESCRLRSYRNKIHFENVFHMSGCYSAAWAHFLTQYFPRLELIDRIQDELTVNIVLPDYIDRHILNMIEFAIKDNPNFKIALVPKDTDVVCSQLFYASIDTYLGDIGIIPTPFHIQLSDSTVEFLAKKGSCISGQYFLEKKSRIFIGRSGGRNIINYPEVVQIFEKFGFTEVTPHLMSFEEKVRIFSDAEFIVGPGSSGFANIIFCRLSPKVLMFLNPSRHQDMLLTKIAKYKNMHFECLLGSEANPGEMDSNYTVDIQELNEYLHLFFS